MTKSNAPKAVGGAQNAAPNAALLHYEALLSSCGNLPPLLRTCQPNLLGLRGLALLSGLGCRVVLSGRGLGLGAQ